VEVREVRPVHGEDVVEIGEVAWMELENTKHRVSRLIEGEGKGKGNVRAVRDGCNRLYHWPREYPWFCHPGVRRCGTQLQKRRINTSFLL
jgi:hypothetical protein